MNMHKKKELEFSVPVETTEKKEEVGLDYQAQKQRRNDMKRIKRQSEELQDEIQKLEIELDTIEDKLVAPEVFNDYEKAQELNERLEQVNQSIEKAMAEWEKAEDKLSEIENY